MTAPLTQQGSASAPGASALGRCVGDPDRFLAQCWGKRAHLNAGSDIAGTLDLDDVDAIVADMALRAPAFRVIKGGTTLGAASYTRTARIGSRTVTDLIDVGRVYGHFAQGATIVLQGLHRYWPPVAELCRSIEAELTHPVQANAYITPPVSQGLRVHADPHDVFAVQTYGRKQWVLYEGHQNPTADGTGGTPTLDVTLEPGDCLYVPKGTHHAARTVDSDSIHLTLGVRSVTWADVLRPVVAGALEDPALNEPLPAGFAQDPAVLAQEASQRLADVAAVIAAADAGAAVQRAARRFWTGRTPALSGQLRQLMRAGEISDATVVRRRPHATCAVKTDGSEVALVLSDRTLRLPAAAEPALVEAVRRDTFAVSDLAQHLDEAGRITLVRRLVREGLLMVVDG